MPARLWESARNNRGVAQIRAGRKMRREDGAKERRAGGRWGYMQVLSELWGSSRYINSFISAADSVGFLGYGKPRLSFNLVGPQTRELSTGVIHGFSEGRVSRARRGNEPFDQENMHLVFMGRACRDSRKKYIFPPHTGWEILGIGFERGKKTGMEIDEIGCNQDVRSW